MAKYKIYKDADGQLSAHTERYTPKEGEKKVGRTFEAASAEEALSQYEEKAKDKGEDEDVEESDESREPTEEEKAEELDRLREEEDSKEDFTVMADAEGNLYVEGDEASDPAKKKKAAAPKAQKEEKPSEVGKFRAKDAKEALERAKGTFKDPAEGQPRGAQTP